MELKTESILFDSLEQALIYNKEKCNPVYMFIWDKGIFTSQFKIELKDIYLNFEIIKNVKNVLDDNFNGKSIFFTNYSSDLLKIRGKLIIKDESCIKIFNCNCNL